MGEYPQGLMCLNVWPLVANTIKEAVETLGSRAKLEDTDHWMWSLRSIAWTYFLSFLLTNLPRSDDHPTVSNVTNEATTVAWPTLPWWIMFPETVSENKSFSINCFYNIFCHRNQNRI